MRFATISAAFRPGSRSSPPWARAGQPLGVTANSFNSVSLDPPLVLFSLDRRAYSLWDFLSTGHFAVNVLAEDQHELSARFARSMSDKFTGVAIETWDYDCPILAHCHANFECSIAYTYAGGDHVIFVGRVERMACDTCQAAAALLSRRLSPPAGAGDGVRASCACCVAAPGARIDVGMACPPAPRPWSRRSTRPAPTSTSRSPTGGAAVICPRAGSRRRAAGPAKGANLILVLIDRAARDRRRPQAAGAGDQSSARRGAARQGHASDAGGPVVIGGISADARGAPGAYRNYVAGKVELTRSSRDGSDGRGMGGANPRTAID